MAAFLLLNGYNIGKRVTFFKKKYKGYTIVSVKQTIDKSKNRSW